MEFLLFGLLALAMPFVLPIASWVSARRTRARVLHLESVVEEQRSELERLSKRLAELRREVRPAPVAEAPEAAVPRAAPPVAAPRAVPPAPVAPPAPVVQNPWPDPPPRKPAEAPAPTPPIVQRPWPELERADARGAAPRPPVPPAAPPPAPPRAARPPASPPPPPPRAFDWESLVGVKLFSAIAGVALVLAAVLFLRHSVQQGWLQPPVRVLIGVLVAVTLLVLCELKAARRYPATANALDAAAIAILFSTFFAAHARWDLIPGGVAFGLLALVTGVAVLLSIRRESLFIAVLGLLGGFATPALLSTGENRPIPLFAYLLLLNVGLAWVAHRHTWPVLTVLTLVLTTIYQWGWAFRFLSASDVPLAMGVFLIFPVTGVAALLLSRGPASGGSSSERATFERTAIVAAAMPVLFAAYLAAVPAYGARPGLLFGFLALVDAGLLAIAIARGYHVLHATGAYATVLVTAVWLGISFRPEFRYTVLAFTSGFAALYLGAPAVARWLSRPLEGVGARAVYAAPLLLFVFPALAYMDPAFAAPQPLFGTLLGLLILCAWRAVATRDAYVFFIGSFFAVAAQAVWSLQHLTVERLGIAVALYATFGIVSAAVPVVARTLGRALQPPEAGGVTLLASLGLLLFLAAGGVAPAALWALALLLAILNAAIFVESAGAGLPATARAGTLLSWVILAVWWTRAAGTVGVIPSLAVLTGLSLVTLVGYAWACRVRRDDGEADGFANGQYLALGGHLFLYFMAIDPRWSVPPWPLFGALAVISLATSATSLATRAAAMHTAGIVGAAAIVMAWTASARGAAGLPAIGVAAASAVSLFALAWIPVARRFDAAGAAAVGAAAALFGSELTLMVAAATSDPPPFAAVVAVHAANAAILLALGWSRRWKLVATAAVIVAAAAVLEWQAVRPAREWRQLLALAAAFYAVFTLYPLVVGPRARDDREPWFVALISAATTFFAARHAFVAAGLDWMIGVVPVVQGLVTAVLLRALLRLEPAGRRDLGRLALVAGAALAFVTVAIPLQLEHQWITIGWTLEGAALAWLYRRVPHRGVLMAATALLGAVFVRLALNPAVFVYEPRSATRILNWYLYTYVIAAAAFFAAAWWLSRTDDRPADGFPRMSRVLPVGAVILLFVLLNIEIADYYATGPEIVFRFGVTLSQDLTYTIGWLGFGMLLLAAGIYARARAARVAAVSLIAVTTFKCFLYDMGSLEGLYRVASFVGLALSLALVSIALQRFVLDASKEPRESTP